ncbi:MAG: hypothetical protein M1831_002174 [Alyxoria varia]|nr:MAG: hypothetical protein M1831_002174 [Alyxoria varia]
MDPVTAFGVAASVIQLFDISVRAVSICRELHKDGTVKELSRAQEVARALDEASKRVESSLATDLKPRNQDDEALLELAKNMSATADEFLNKVKDMNTTFRIMRGGKTVAEFQSKLEEYRRILDTRILLKLQLDVKSLDGHLDVLSRSVRDLYLAMDSGKNQVDQLLTSEIQSLRNLTLQTNDSAAAEGLKAKLSFPEMFTRQQQISKVQLGTYQWMFRENIDDMGGGDSSEEYADNSELLDSDSEAEYEDSEAEYEDSTMERNRYLLSHIQSESNFMKWLQNPRSRAYWITGYAASGKSTLLSFCFHNAETRNALQQCCPSDTQIVMVSYFFWKPGTYLQKSLQGLLRTLLFQIVDCRPELIRTLFERSPEGPTHSLVFDNYQLSGVFDRCIELLPMDLLLFVCIDGLDEGPDEEQDKVLQLIERLQTVPQVKVLFSSRPEEQFRQTFKNLPLLRLDLLNSEDIEKTAKEKLAPVLGESLTGSQIDHLITRVVEKAQGVFLWAEIVIRQLEKGARSCETAQELFERLEILPGKLEELFSDMIHRMDEKWRTEAFQYFYMINTSMEIPYHRPLTLITLAAASEEAWALLKSRTSAHEVSLSLFKRCESTERRVLTRCVGLVNFIDRSEEDIYHPSDQSLVSHIDSAYYGKKGIPKDTIMKAGNYELIFIHRTVPDFLEEHYSAHFRHCSRRSTILKILYGFVAQRVLFDRVQVPEPILVLLSVLEVQQRKFRDEAKLLSHPGVYQLLSEVLEVMQKFDSPSSVDRRNFIGFSLLNAYSVRLKMFDSLSAACYVGLSDIDHRLLTPHGYKIAHLDHCLLCSLIGFTGGFQSDFVHYTWREGKPDREYTLDCAELFLSLGANPNSTISFVRLVSTNLKVEITAWSLFASCAILNPGIRARYTEFASQGLSLVQLFLSYGADVNVAIFKKVFVSVEKREHVFAVIEESLYSALTISRSRDEVLGQREDLIKPFCDLITDRGGKAYRRCRMLASMDDWANKFVRGIHIVHETNSDFWLSRLDDGSINSEFARLRDQLDWVPESELDTLRPTEQPKRTAATQEGYAFEYARPAS